MKVIAQQGDTLDLICWRYYGQSNSGVVESVLLLNPALAEFGAILPHGTIVTLPDAAATAVDTKMVNLWD